MPFNGDLNSAFYIISTTASENDVTIRFSKEKFNLQSDSHQWKFLKEGKDKNSSSILPTLCKIFQSSKEENEQKI